ncbi:hypothetical protein SAMN05216420_11090 [Nitrosospira sp. Nl5]|nr:hypothetical protein SAMN05216420_11090 [Nitrosospira sp. Nl5]
MVNGRKRVRKGNYRKDQLFIRTLTHLIFTFSIGLETNSHAFLALFPFSGRIHIYLHLERK